MTRSANSPLVAIFLACSAVVSCEGASPILDHRGTQAPITPWQFPTVQSGFMVVAGSGAPGDQSPEGAWFVLDVKGSADLVHDAQRELLYVSTNAGEVVRYDLKEHAVIAGLTLGGQLSAMDQSPDGSTLLVADLSPGAPCIHVVDLASEQSRKVVLPLADASHARPYSLAFIDAERVLIAQEPPVADLLLLTLADDAVRPVHRVRSRTKLAYSPDRSVITFVSNGTPPKFGRYRVADDVFEEAEAESTVFQALVSPKGDQYAVATTNSLVVYGPELARVRAIPGNGPVGIAYAADGEQLIAAFEWFSAIQVYDAPSGQHIAALDTFTSSRPKTSNIEASPDGRWLFTKAGDRIVSYVLTP